MAANVQRPPTRIAGQAASEIQQRFVALLRLLGAIGDDLFGRAEEAVAVSGNTIIGYFATAILTAAIMLTRRLDLLANPQFQVEDGPIFFRQNLVFGFERSVTMLFQGFPYLAQRLLAEAATPFGIVNAPLAYLLLGVITTSLALACFSLPHFRHILQSDALRLVFCLVVAALPEAQEVVGTITNVHWFLGIWVLLTAVMHLPRSRLGLALLLVVNLICVFSMPVAILWVPIWICRLIHAGLRRNIRGMIAAVVILASSALVFAIAPTLGARGNLKANYPFSMQAFLNLLAVRIISGSVAGIRGTWKLLGDLPLGSFYLLAALALCLYLGLSALAQGRNLRVALVCAYGIIGSLLATMLGRTEWNVIGLQPSAILGEGGRYFVLSSALIYLGLLAAVDRHPPGTLKTVLTTSLLWGLVFVTLQTYFLPPLIDMHWPQEAAELEAKLASDDPTPVVLPTNPPGWWITVGLSAHSWTPTFGVPTMRSDVNIPAEETAGEIAKSTQVVQTFVSQCNNLAFVNLLTATYDHVSAEPVVVQLVDIATARVVVERTIPGPTIPNNSWLGIAFKPLTDSYNAHYRLIVTAPTSNPGNAITIYRSKTDAYPDGEAIVNGIPTGGDLVFGYGCGT